MGEIFIYPPTVSKPITLIGHRAGVCYGADVSNETKNYNRGLDCIKHNHGRTLEFVDIHLGLKGYSAKVIREWYTHIGGSPTRLQASTRYINYDNFDYIVPETIQNNPDALALFESTIRTIQDTMKTLKTTYHIPREDSSMLCPFCMATTMVDKRNLRNLVDMSRQRECSRAFWEYRQLFSDIKKALAEYSDEWTTLIDMLFHPKCVEYRYCPEGNQGCGRYPTKEEIEQQELSECDSES